MTPYQRHKEQSHAVTRESHNGINITEACETCKLAWLMPHKHQQDQNPITLYHYWGGINNDTA